jgi:hypothetical protein
MMRLRHLAPAALAVAALAGCGGGDDEGGDEGNRESADTAAETTADAGGGAKPIDFELVERVTPDILAKDKECPPGEFSPSRDPLTTITEEDAKKAKTPPQSYSCGGRVDQVIWAEFEDEADAQKLLDPANTSNAATLVSGNTVVLVNLGIEPEVKIKELFDAIQQECDCGETRHTG